MASPNTLALRNQIEVLKSARKVYASPIYKKYKDAYPKPMSRRDKIRAGLINKKGEVK